MLEIELILLSIVLSLNGLVFGQLYNLQILGTFLMTTSFILLLIVIIMIVKRLYKIVKEKKNE